MSELVELQRTKHGEEGSAGFNLHAQREGDRLRLQVLMERYGEDYNLINLPAVVRDAESGWDSDDDSAPGGGVAVLEQAYCHICVLILLYVSAYCCIRVLVLLYVCPHTAFYVFSYCYIRVLTLLDLCPHTAVYVSLCCDIGVLKLLHMGRGCIVART
jgi:hypothetical protein